MNINAVLSIPSFTNSAAFVLERCEIDADQMALNLMQVVAIQMQKRHFYQNFLCNLRFQSSPNQRVV